MQLCTQHPQPCVPSADGESMPASDDAAGGHGVTAEDFEACLQRMTPSLTRGSDMELEPGDDPVVFLLFKPAQPLTSSMARG